MADLRAKRLELTRAAIHERLLASDYDDVRVVVGGIVPPRDIDALKALGVERVFPMGTPLPEIVRAFKERG